MLNSQLHCSSLLAFLCMGQSVSTEPHRMTCLLSGNRFLSFVREQRSLKRFLYAICCWIILFQFDLIEEKKKANKTINHGA